MNKKADVSLSLKFIIGLIIALIAIWFLFSVANKLIILNYGKTDSQISFFNELSEKINDNSKSEIKQLFELRENYLLVSFNKEDSKIDLGDVEIYSGNKEEISVMLKKPNSCEICLCLCNTKDDVVLLENDCLQQEDICMEFEKEIKKDEKSFFLFKKGLIELKITKTDKINIEYE